MGPDLGDLAVEANAFRTVFKPVTETYRLLSKGTIWGGGWGTDPRRQLVQRTRVVQA